MNETQIQHYSRIVAKCWADAEFKARLLADPQATLSTEGVEIPAGITLRVVENTADDITLILPPPPLETELTEAQLNEISGGFDRRPHD